MKENKILELFMVPIYVYGNLLSEMQTTYEHVVNSNNLVKLKAVVKLNAF